jgi:hypothetical protein
MTINIKEMFEKGITGKVKYNEIEDSYQLDLGALDVGLYPIWEDFEGQRVKITVEVINSTTQGASHSLNKDLEVSASPTPKKSQKAIPSLNPYIKLNLAFCLPTL